MPKNVKLAKISRISAFVHRTFSKFDQFENKGIFDMPRFDEAAYVIGRLGSKRARGQGLILRPEAFQAVDGDEFKAIEERFPTMLLQLLLSNTLKSMDTAWKDTLTEQILYTLYNVSA